MYIFNKLTLFFLQHRAYTYVFVYESSLLHLPIFLDLTHIHMHTPIRSAGLIFIVFSQFSDKLLSIVLDVVDKLSKVDTFLFLFK